MAPSVISSSMAGTSKRPAASDVELHGSPPPQDHDGRASKQQQQQQCPRCESTDTKFCYYNNYSMAQPRHFCRACRRYWTHGGTLRDVPVGGGSRRSGNKRRKISGPPPPPPPPSSAGGADMYIPADICPNAGALPFGNDGIYLPQFDHGIAPEIVPGVPDFYHGLTTWDGGSPLGAAGMTSAWQEIADLVSLELGWPPPDN